MTNKFDMGNIDIAWCPGCGDFGILATLKEVFSELNYDPKDVVLVSGIGQAAKTPQYVKSNFFNGLHGRALPPATGISLSNPNLKVIVTSGDGDMYGEGGNHFIHAIRRNPNITVFVYNNMIYGLTKGQASPTSLVGMKTPVQVNGVFLEPFNPLAVAISLDASFVARTSITDIEHSKEIFKKALEHKGFSLVDIFQPCVSFNKLNTYEWFRDNTYYLNSNHDVHDRNLAFSKATETIEHGKLPLGIFYISKEKKTINEFVIGNTKDSTPLYNHEVDYDKLDKLLDSKIEREIITNSVVDDNEFVAKIVEQWNETHNVKSFVLAVSNFSFKSGQHISVGFKDGRKINGKDKIPLSISNPPTDKDKIIITFKEVGLFTSELAKCKIGDELIISKPFGNTFIVDDKTADDFIILSGGTGITPFMSGIRFLLAKNMKNNVILFDGNLTENDIIFRDELGRINNERDNVKIVHVLSNATSECGIGEKGFITKDLILKYANDLSKYKWMICGPPVMIKAMQSVLIELNIPKEKILVEEWNQTCEPAKKLGDNMENAILSNGTKEVELSPGPIIKAAEELGVPFLCRQGVCGTCKITIEEGMENLEELTEKEKAMNLAPNQRLSCQAKIKGGKVRISF
ncbi:2Fe-2S iron-sulfur cluster binding domain-containing protein [Candidatus Woesearchaeota archaeon]|nr:2Fe-2S iron-sulfur cluster binding domain-containing protein [Candidatus Woesearchaeota archaeon]